MPGKRGSRRLTGDHLLTQHDLLSGKFADAVAIGGWPLDDHPPGGFDRPDLPPNTVIRPPEVYDIPLRALYSRKIPNLMMAGRNISATHAAFTSTRVMATCAVIGQAVGAAAAMCAERGITPRQLAADPKLVGTLQQTLLRDDQTIKHVRSDDRGDLARRARVTASAEIAPAVAALVIDGSNRDVPGKDGRPIEFHHWAAPADGSPWIELAWDKPERISRVQLTFDTGFQRELTLTASDSHTRGTIREAQPETVRDYTVAYRKSSGGDLLPLVSVERNHQRVNRHRFEPVEAQVIRLQVTATNGDPLARIVEIRCYG